MCHLQINPSKPSAVLKRCYYTRIDRSSQPVVTVRIYSFSKCCKLLRDVRVLQPDSATDRSVAFLVTSPTERSWVTSNDDDDAGTGRQEATGFIRSE